MFVCFVFLLFNRRKLDSCVSKLSDWSMDRPVNFTDGCQPLSPRRVLLGTDEIRPKRVSRLQSNEGFISFAQILLQKHTN